MFDSAKSAAEMLMENIVACPAERHLLHATLCDKIADLRRAGQPVPRDLVRLELALQEPEDDDIWDNMPI